MGAALDIFISCMEIALPIAFVFEMGNLIVGTVCRAAFGGWLRIGR